MKTKILLIQLIFLFFFISCKKEESNISTGITFQYYDVKTNTTSILVYYDEIFGYDSLKCTFVLEELSWDRLKKKVEKNNFFVSPFPDFIINVAINNNLIYRAGYVPPLSSSTVGLNKVLFELKEPNFLTFKFNLLDNTLKGKASCNNLELIKCLKKDKKLIKLQ